MLLTTELDKFIRHRLAAVFLRRSAQSRTFAELDAFVTAAAAEKIRLPRGGEHLRRVPRLPGVGGAGRHSGAGPLP